MSPAQPAAPDLVVVIRDANRPDAPPLLVTGGEAVLRAVLLAVAETLGVAAVPPRLLRLTKPEGGDV